MRRRLKSRSRFVALALQLGQKGREVDVGPDVAAVTVIEISVQREDVVLWFVSL